MRYTTILMTLIGAMILIGCDQGETTTATPAPADGTAGSGAAIEAGARDAAADAADTVDAAKQDAAGAVKEAKEAGTEAVSTIQGQAQQQLDQAMQYIKENKFDLAEQAIVKLEGMKAQLPETMQSAIGNARSALDTAKKAQGMLPAGAGAAPR